MAEIEKTRTLTSSKSGLGLKNIGNSELEFIFLILLRIIYGKAEFDFGQEMFGNDCYSRIFLGYFSSFCKRIEASVYIMANDSIQICSECNSIDLCNLCLQQKKAFNKKKRNTTYIIFRNSTVLYKFVLLCRN